MRPVKWDASHCGLARDAHQRNSSHVATIATVSPLGLDRTVIALDRTILSII
jgi:hypothetical protein